MTIAAMLLGGCSGGTSSPGGSSPANAATSNGLSIAGNPSQSVAVGTSYTFRPTVSEVGAAMLTFAITNPPAWATFDPATGTLSGTPTTANLGKSPEIVISVSDGSASATLAAFSIDVTQGSAGLVTLSWTEPLVNASAATPTLAGYHIYFGATSKDLTHVVTVTDPAVTDYVVSNLATGTWYFAIASYDTNHIESVLSSIVPVTI